MPSKSNEFSHKDHALGVMLAECADLERSDPGEPVTTEELAVLVEGKADSLLGHARRQQIITQLAQDSELYEQWLALSELYQLDEHPIIEPKEKPSTLDSPLSGLIDRVVDFFSPKVLVTAFSVTLALVLSRDLWDPVDTTPPPLVVQNGDPLPEKASRGDVSHQPVSASSSEEITKRIVCHDIGVEKQTALCYSNTPLRQHWFLFQPPYHITALTPLVDADNLISVQSLGSMLLLEYKQSSLSKLSLLALDITGQELSSRILHEDQVADGFFDELRLQSDRLEYSVLTPGATPESRQFLYERSLQ
jgi:hypothetical protein